MKYIPKMAVWELTNRCNARCIHCGSSSGKCRENELTEEEALRVCQELHELGCERVGVIGGEFFLSPYWEAVVQKLLELGIRPSLLTNGLLLNDENIMKLKDMGIGAMSVSIDGIGEQHDYLRGVPGLYNIAIANIKKAQAVDFRIGINTAVSKKNVHDLDDIFVLLQELGVNSWQIQAVEDLGRANENPELSLTAADLYLAAQKIAKFRQNSTMRVIPGDNVGHFAYFEPSVRDYPFNGCLAGRLAIGIEANGNIRGCLSIRGDENVVGNISERLLRDLWEDPETFAAFRCKPLEKMEGFCAECEYARICRGGCSSMAHSLTGNFYENPLCLHKYEVEMGLKPEAI